MTKKVFPIYLIFLSMGMIDAVGPMVSLARESFSISITMAALLPLLGYLMYGLLAIPVGLLQDRKGKVLILNAGLAIAFAGLMIPVFSGMYGTIKINDGSLVLFYKILLAILLLGSGGAILQVAGHPFIRDISAAGRYSKNLSMALAFLSIGSSLGFLLPTFIFNVFGLDWSILFPVFSSIILLSFISLNTSIIKESRKAGSHNATLQSCLGLLKRRYVFVMVLGLFIYCGVEIAMSSHIPILLKDKYLISLEKMGLLISWSLFYLPIFLGRFLGSLILTWIAPKRLLFISGIISLSGILMIFSGNLILALSGILIIGFGFSNMFPLIFYITVDHIPQLANELSGLMVATISGGAFIPLIMGFVADNYSISVAFIVPFICIAYLIFISIKNFAEKQDL